ncbi:MAG TPA: hypothetical protein VF395_04745 [Polyangiaceae bacterium]
MLDPWADDARYFFVHVMMVPALPIVHALQTHVYDKRYFYPNDEDVDGFKAYMDYGYVKTLPEERRKLTKVFTGHLPLAAKPYFGSELKAFSFFSDPVERAVAQLAEARRIPWMKQGTPEEVWNDRGTHDAFLDNVLTRFFAVRDLESGSSIFDARLPANADTLSAAKDAVETLDFIGLMEDFAASMRMLGERYSWPIPLVEGARSPITLDIPERLRERIANDLELDRRFHEHVQRLYSQRKAAHDGPERFTPSAPGT